MTRPSKRELENELDEIGGSGECSVQDLLLASVKNVHDSELTTGEQQLLDDPEAHLSETAHRQSRRMEFDA